MSEKGKIASDIFGGGRNCAQSVFCAFCEDYGVEKEVAARIAGGFGSGVRSGQICGAVSGGVMVIGLKYGESKEVCSSKTEEFIGKFREQNKSAICRDIMGLDVSTTEGREKAVSLNLFKTTCKDMVTNAADILEELGY